MIVAIVTFNLPEPTSLEQITKVFRGTAPKYQGMPGLLRKNYWMSEDGKRAGGIYVGRPAPMPTESIRRNGRPSWKANTVRRPSSSISTRQLWWTIARVRSASQRSVTARFSTARH